MPDGGPPRAAASRPLLIAAVVLFAAIFVVRLIVDVPGWGITLLYDIPVALLAVGFGFRIGLIGAAVAIVLFALGENLAPIHVGEMTLHPNASGYISRAVVFFLLGGLLGMYSDRLRKAREEVAAQNRELERSNAELAQFADLASHDLQEPLRVIRGFVELLARRYRGQLDEDADKFIASTLSGVDRMQSLIEAFLSYSRVGNSHAKLQTVDTAALVRKVEARVRESAEGGDLELAAVALPRVQGDPVLLEQLFDNLITNAVKFSDSPEPQVKVSAARENGTWLFAVADDGPGVDPAQRERIFEMFKRLHGESMPGTGIGLAICKRITELHGGRIWVESEEGNGSTFKFTLAGDRAVD